MVERVVRIHEVRGSIPLISTNDFREYQKVLPEIILSQISHLVNYCEHHQKP